MTLIFPLTFPEVLSTLKLGSNDILTLEVAPGSSEWVYCETANGGTSFNVKFRGKLDPLVSISSRSSGIAVIFLSQKYLKFIFFYE